MEQYGDERFMNVLRNRQVLSRNKDIQQGPVFVGEEPLQFAEREIIKKKFWIWLPENFTLMSRQLAKMKYLNENRPEIIYMNEMGDVNIAFSHKKDNIQDGQEVQMRDLVEQIILRLYPSSQTIEKQICQIGEKQVAWFDFISPALDADVYNLMFFSSIGKRLFVGSCNCTKQDQDVWKPLFLQMIACMRFA